MRSHLESGLRLGILAALLLATRAGAQDFAPCPGLEPGLRAECGTVTVPEDRTKPGGRTLDLNVLVLRAESPAGRAPVFFLAGGPGQGATDLIGLALGPYADVRKSRDFVFVDQRGTGKSNPLSCPSNSETDPQTAFGGLFDPARIAACSEQAERHADLRRYGTLDVVEDLEQVCEQLGYRKVLLWGGSGGTRTAQVWLREHPGRIEAVVLDGVVPNDFHAPSSYARGSQDALEHVYADCEAQASCQAAYPHLRADFESLLRRFDAGPVETFVTRASGERVPVRMQRGDFGYAVRGMLYRSGQIAILPRMIHDAATSGDLSPFAQQYWMRDVGLQPFIAQGVHLAVFATEDVPYIDRSAIPSLTKGTFLGTYLIDQYTAGCKAWGGRGVLPPGFHDPVRSDVPVLLISGYYDPSTPPQMAAQVAKFLPNSRQVIARNEGHGAGFACARQLVVDFLTTGSLAGLGPACEDTGPVVFEVPRKVEK